MKNLNNISVIFTLKTIALLCAIVICVSCSQPTNIERLDGSYIEEKILSNNINELIKNANVSGLGIAIIKSDKTVFQETLGYANATTNDTLNENDVFIGASLSKAVFGYLVMLLVNEGVIDLDTPLVNYLDKPIWQYHFENPHRSYEALKNDTLHYQVTARMCLSHTTGLPNWRWMTRENDFNREGEIRFLIPPNTRYFYSGEGINLLQFVLEQKTGKSLEELAQERVFIPLKMTSTTYEWMPKLDTLLVAGHTKQSQIVETNKKKEASAASSLKTSLADYVKFIQHLLKVYQNDKKQIAEMLTPNVKITGKHQMGFHTWTNVADYEEINLSYGLGFGLFKTPFSLGVFKEGHDNGFQHYSVFFPEKNIGIIMLSNSDNAESIYKELLELTIKDTYTPYKWLRYE